MDVLPLPICGLMSEKSCDEITEKVADMLEEAKKLGIPRTSIHLSRFPLGAEIERMEAMSAMEAQLNKPTSSPITEKPHERQVHR